MFNLAQFKKIPLSKSYALVLMITSSFALLFLIVIIYSTHFTTFFFRDPISPQQAIISAHASLKNVQVHIVTQRSLPDYQIALHRADKAIQTAKRISPIKTAPLEQILDLFYRVNSCWNAIESGDLSIMEVELKSILSIIPKEQIYFSRWQGLRQRIDFEISNQQREHASLSDAMTFIENVQHLKQEYSQLVFDSLWEGRRLLFHRSEAMLKSLEGFDSNCKSMGYL